MQVTTEMLMAIGGKRAKREICEPMVPLIAKWFPEIGIDTEMEAAQFLGQMAVESAGFSDLDENLWYREATLIRTWPKRYNSGNAHLYAKNPERLANSAYANRMGNGPPESGEGWKYRGRGLKQLTGKSNYRAFTKWANERGIAVDFVTDPDLVQEFPYAFLSGAWFWDANDLSNYAGDTKKATKRINGGYNGLKQRVAAVNKALAILPDDGWDELEAGVPIRSSITDEQDKDGDGMIDLGKVGKVHASVAAIHQGLDKAGYRVEHSTLFSHLTAQAVRKFQSDQGLVVDGIFGRGTRAALEAAIGGPLALAHLQTNEEK